MIIEWVVKYQKILFYLSSVSFFQTFKIKFHKIFYKNKHLYVIRSIRYWLPFYYPYKINDSPIFWILKTSTYEARFPFLRNLFLSRNNRKKVMDHLMAASSGNASAAGYHEKQVNSSMSTGFSLVSFPSSRIFSDFFYGHVWLGLTSVKVFHISHNDPYFIFMDLLHDMFYVDWLISERD